MHAREIAWRQSMQQLEENNLKRNKYISDQYEQNLTAKLTEQRRLLNEGFRTEADQLRRDIANLRSRRH